MSCSRGDNVIAQQMDSGKVEIVLLSHGHTPRKRMKLSAFKNLLSLVVSEAETTKRRLSNANSITSPSPKPNAENSGQAASWAVSFERLLEDKAGLATFTEFLKKEFSEENMAFWMICEDFKTLTEQSELKEQAQAIYDKYLSAQASDPVNIDSEARNNAQKAMESPTADMFCQAQLQIFQLMKRDSYVRFLKSELYRSCVEAEIEGKTLPFTREEPLQTHAQTQSTEKTWKKSLKKSKSASGIEVEEEKRRRSILPWNRNKSGKRVKKMNTEPDLRKASHNKEDRKCGHVSVGSTDINTLGSHVAPSIQITERVKDKCEGEVKEKMADNGKKVKCSTESWDDASQTADGQFVFEHQ